MLSPAHPESVELKEFFSGHNVIKFEQDERVIRPWELEHNVMLIKSGALKAFAISKSGRQVVLGYLNGGQGQVLFGLSPEMNKYYMEALTPVEAWVAPKKDFFSFAQKHPQVFRDLMFAIVEVMKALFEQIEWLKSGNSRRKVASVLRHMAIKFGKKEHGAVTVGIKLTHQAVGDLVGLTRETAITQIEKLRKKGIIQFKESTLTVLDMDRLAEESDIEGTGVY